MEPLVLGLPLVGRGAVAVAVASLLSDCGPKPDAATAVVSQPVIR
jgi:hypothetical protein